MTDDRDLYKILHVDPEADPDVITAAFRVLARKLHPDIDATGVHEYRMAELNRAYKVLKDSAERKAYDLRRALTLVPVGPGPGPGPGQGPIPFADELPSHLADRWSSRNESVQEAGLVTIDFGRYKGQTLHDVARYDPDYLRWLSRHSSGIRYRGAISRVLDLKPTDAYSGRPSR
ncbi:MAG TPA: DnaJ domain-containing protein [Candidatus Dormibacteraeota bacterium]|nr:DnaJ domain-containing protein [Candidatus Dormibacteraeota bacterium]